MAKSKEKILLRFANNDNDDKLQITHLFSDQWELDFSHELNDPANEGRTSVVAESLTTNKIIGHQAVYDKGDDYPNKKYWLETTCKFVFDDKNLEKYCIDNKCDIILKRKDICEGEDLIVLPSYRGDNLGSFLSMSILFVAKNLNKIASIGMTTKYANRIWDRAIVPFLSIEVEEADKYDETSRMLFPDIDKSCDKCRPLMNSLLKSMVNSRRFSYKLSGKIAKMFIDANIDVPKELMITSKL